MPASWNEAAIENVKVGDNAISLTVNQKEDHLEYRIQQKEEDWLVIINVKNSKSIKVNGVAIDNSKIIDGLLTLTGQQNIVQVY
jgi:hypothetical protein